MNRPMTNTSKTVAAARSKARKMADDLANDALDAAERLSVKAERGLSRARRAAAETTAGLAGDLDTAADDAGRFARRTVYGLSHRAHDLTDGLRSTSLSDVLGQARVFARRNPGVVAAGALLVGLLLARAAAPRTGRTRRR